MSLEEFVVKDLLKLIKQKDISDDVRLRSIDCIQSLLLNKPVNSSNCSRRNEGISATTQATSTSASASASPYSNKKTLMKELSEKLESRSKN